MTALSLTYTLTNGTPNDATQVMQDLNDIKTYINASTMRIDGNNTMTGETKLLNSNPTLQNGAVRKAYMDGAYVYASGGTSQIFTSGVAKTIVFSAKTFDYTNGSGDTSAGNYTLASGVFTSPLTGVYLVEFSVSPPSGCAYSHRMSVLADGVTYNGQRTVTNSAYAGGTGSQVITFTIPVRCTAAATIEPQVTIDSGVTQTIGGHVTIAWLHA